MPEIDDFSTYRHTSSLTAAASLLIRCGLDPVRLAPPDKKVFAELAASQARERHPHALRLIDVVRSCVQLDGLGLHDDPGELMNRAAASPSLLDVFDTLAGAALMDRYDQGYDTTVWCSHVESVPNFKPQDRRGLGFNSGLKRVPRGGQATHAELGEVASETYRVSRYARRFEVDQQDLLDDRLGAIMASLEDIGRGAAPIVPDLVYSLLLANPSLATDGIALFHADHGNTGTTALSSSAVGTAMAAMSSQRLDGQPMRIRAKWLIVPPALEVTAATVIRALSTSDQPRLELIVEPRIGPDGVTDPATETAYSGTDTNWYVVGEAARTFEVGYLAATGRRPRTRVYPMPNGPSLIGMDVKLDVGVCPLDFRALYRSTGTT